MSDNPRALAAPKKSRRSIGAISFSQTLKVRDEVRDKLEFNLFSTVSFFSGLQAPSAAREKRKQNDLIGRFLKITVDRGI
jgi:hypothetical protein